MTKWKLFTNFDKFEKNKALSKKKKFVVEKSSFPGRIDNVDLLVSLNSFANNGDINETRNQVILPTCNEFEDFEILSFEQFSFLLERYGGGPVIKKSTYEAKSEITGESKLFIDIYSQKCTVIFLNPSKDLKTKRGEEKVTYLSKEASVADLKAKIVNDFLKNKIILSDIHLWKTTKEFVDNNPGLFSFKSKEVITVPYSQMISLERNYIKSELKRVFKKTRD